MAKTKVRQQEQTGIERMELAIQLVCYTLMSFIVIKEGMSSLLLLIIWAAWVTNLVMVLTSARDYYFRAMTAAALSQLALLLWVLAYRDIFDAIPMFLVFVLILGFYGIPDLIAVSALAATVIYFFVSACKAARNCRDQIKAGIFCYW